MCYPEINCLSFCTGTRQTRGSSTSLVSN